MRVVCKIHHAGGHTETASIDLPADGKGAKGGDVMTRTHAMGSAISYARRYLIGMIFSLAIEKDDDGNSAGGYRPQQPPAAPPRRPPASTETRDVNHKAREAFISTTKERIRQFSSHDVLRDFWNSPEQRRARKDFELTREELDSLIRFVTAKRDALKAFQQAAE